MVDDGTPLQSASHPYPEDLIELLCRAVCRAEGLDPDHIAGGLGVSMPKGSTYPLWQARRRIVIAMLDANGAWEYEHQPSDLSEDPLTSGKINPIIK